VVGVIFGQSLENTLAYEAHRQRPRCHCRPNGPMCLLHFGALTKREKRQHKRKIGVR
jgi:hypothetical protein